MNMALGDGKHAKMNIFGVPYLKIKKSNLRSLLSSFIKIGRVLKSSNWYFGGRKTEIWGLEFLETKVIFLRN